MYKVILFSLLFYFVTSETSEVHADFVCSQETYSNGYEFYPGFGWVRYHPIPTQWAEARLRCLYEGAELMSPTNKEMMQVLAKIGADKDTFIWTGVHSTDSKGDYFSINGIPLHKMPISWAQNEPNNYNDSEECMVMYKDGKMADVSCNYTYTFACYKPEHKIPSRCGDLLGYEYNEKTGNCYKFHNVSENWIRAFMICAAEGAHLAMVDTPGEEKVLVDIFKKHPANLIHGDTSCGYVHLGFRDWGNHNTWVTFNGKKIEDLVKNGITHWNENEPSFGKKFDEYCGSMHSSGGLNDIACKANKAPFICEIESEKCYNN